jgi:hypothetical protein
MRTYAARRDKSEDSGTAGVGLTLPVLLGGLLLATANPAAACSCPSESEAQQAARADAVFVGTVLSRVNLIDQAAVAGQAGLIREGQRRPYRPDRIQELMRRVTNSSDRAVLTFEVRRVYKGAVGKRQEIVSRMSNDTCRREFADRGPFLMFAWRPSPDASGPFQLEPGQYRSDMNICNRSRILADGGEPALGMPSDESGWPDSLVDVGILAAGVAAGLVLATLRARRRAHGADP